MTPKTESSRARKAARAALSLTYQGQPCRHGHAMRYTANALCVDCAKHRRALQTELERDARNG